ncbi:hypothetical protein ABZX30_31150 [Streptomyces sp. NPDC004542]|uniref:hypothetical protein n=1 Tax=Streptomyces sp. NPDC004542 TaxID=3154281 RepID=UPI0033BBA952
MTLVCGHDAPAYGPPLCAHLRAVAETDYFLRYTGVGWQSEHVCEGCRDESPPATEQVCEECFDDLLGRAEGVVGAPQIAEAPRPLDPTVDTTPLPGLAGEVVDMAPTERGLLLLGEDGRLLLWDVPGGDCTEVGRSSVAPAADANPRGRRSQTRRLHASSDGRFAAVVIDYGRHGEVIDLTSGSVTRHLENDGYHSDTVPFSLAFTTHGERQAVLYRDQWNRIVACDPATGETLASTPASGEDAPWNRYFHGALLPSPRGTHIVSDAWQWHPVGSVLVWNAGPESSLPTGPADWSQLAFCDYYWDRPLAWIGENRLAVGGIGEDDETLVNGATLYELTGAGDTQWVEAGAFPGPHGRFFAADGLLFSAGESGLEVWDPVEGARTGSVPGFRPTHHDPRTGELLQLDADAGVLRGWHVGKARAQAAGL